MAFTTGFWVDAPAGSRTKGTAANMNRCLMGWGPVADFPAAAAANKGQIAYATDEHIFYYSDGSAWQPAGTRDLADMLERDHASLTNVTSDQHHARAHAVDGASDHSAGTQGDILYAAAAGAWTRLGAGAAGYRLKTQGAGANPIWVAEIAAIEFIIDGGGAAIATGQKGHIEVPFACTINQVTTLADQSGSIVVDIWKDSYANFPPTVADTICAAAKPTLAAAQKAQDSTLTGWTTAIAAGDILAYNVDSATTVTRVLISLKVTKT